jgi:hypothetical protein
VTRRWPVVLAAAILLATAVTLAVAAPILSASPSPGATATPLPIIVPGDPRSEGEGPGLVGSPLAVLAGVIVLGVAAAVVTALVVRLARQE